MKNTYQVFTALRADSSHFANTVTLKAESPYQAAVNALRFLGWADAGNLALVHKGDGFNAYETPTVAVDVMTPATA